MGELQIVELKEGRVLESLAVLGQMQALVETLACTESVSDPQRECQWTLHFRSYNDRTMVFNQLKVSFIPGTHDHTTLVNRCTGE